MGWVRFKYLFLTYKFAIWHPCLKENFQVSPCKITSYLYPCCSFLLVYRWPSKTFIFKFCFAFSRPAAFWYRESNKQLNKSKKDFYIWWRCLSFQPVLYHKLHQMFDWILGFELYSLLFSERDTLTWSVVPDFETEELKCSDEWLILSKWKAWTFSFVIINLS